MKGFLLKTDKRISYEESEKTIGDLIDTVELTMDKCRAITKTRSEAAAACCASFKRC